MLIAFEFGNVLPVTIRKARHVHRAPGGGIDRFKGGQFITQEVVAREAARAYSAIPGTLAVFSDRMQFLRRVYEQNAALSDEGKTGVEVIPLHQVETEMQATIAQVYGRAFILGKRASGDLFSASGGEEEQVKQIRDDEYRFLQGFTEHIKDGHGRMPYAERMEMYVAAARELFWLGWVLGNRQADRRIEWHYGDTDDHCPDCSRFAAHGPYDYQEFVNEVVRDGYLPQAGKLACVGYRCRCWLSDTMQHIPSHDVSPDWLRVEG